MGQLEKILKSKLSKSRKNLASKMRFSIDRIKCLELMENQARNKQRGEECAGTLN